MSRLYRHKRAGGRLASRMINGSKRASCTLTWQPCSGLVAGRAFFFPPRPYFSKIAIGLVDNVEPDEFGKIGR
jgi:hypothetical protein